jgi:hypothetical protein
MESRAENFDTFWWHYLREHGKEETRALHIAGTGLAALCAIAALRSLASRPGERNLDPLTWITLAALSGYGPAWVGHFFYEGNRPATFQHQLWSLVGDLKMSWLWLTGRLERQLAMAGALGVSPQGTVAKKR